MKFFNYNIILRPEPEGGFTVFVPSLPGCITYGKDVREAKAMALDAITLYVETLVEDGEPVPSDEETLYSSIQINVENNVKSRVYA